MVSHNDFDDAGINALLDAAPGSATTHHTDDAWTIWVPLKTDWRALAVVCQALLSLVKVAELVFTSRDWQANRATIDNLHTRPCRHRLLLGGAGCAQPLLVTGSAVGLWPPPRIDYSVRVGMVGLMERHEEGAQPLLNMVLPRRPTKKKARSNGSSTNGESTPAGAARLSVVHAFATPQLLPSRPLDDLFDLLDGTPTPAPR
jgi:hypothetical protein